MKSLLCVVLVFFASTGAFAQYHTFKANADRAFKNKNYYEAAYYYNKAADNKRSQEGKIPFYSGGKATKAQIQKEYPYIWYQLAESYRLYQDYANAEVWYNKLISTGHGVNYPLIRLWYGICLRADEHFDEALKQLQQFEVTYRGDANFIAMAQRELADCVFAKQQYAFHRQLTVTKMVSPWNAGSGDYALVKNKDSYWFTSSRLTTGSIKNLNNIYEVTTPNTVTPVMVRFNSDEKAYDAEYGAITIDDTGTKMYLTRWYKKGSETVLAIYFSQLVNNLWSIPQKLNNKVNADGFNALQPFITTDGKKLFFASDKPGGQGGYDIWVSNLDSGGVPLDAVNLGKTINTQFDEEAPFYDDSNKLLIYGSKGFTGLGGFDLFRSFVDKGQWSVPENLGYPVNSSKDDLYYYPDPNDKNKFYISSDRESECCLNLFQGLYKHYLLTGTITDCETQNKLAGVKVSLQDSVSGQIINHSETGINAQYIFEVDMEHSYKIVLDKEGYFSKTIPLSLKPDIDTLLNPDICLQAFKIDKPIVINNILYDFNKASLRPQAEIALDGIVTIMTDNPAIKIELASHTDSVGGDTYNLKLSKQRAQSCVDYIVSKGISNDRVIAKGYGKTRPVAPNSFPDGRDNPDGRQLNRRTEFTVKK